MLCEYFYHNLICVCLILSCMWFVVFFFKQKTAYEMRISDWSSDVCSSDLRFAQLLALAADVHADLGTQRVLGDHRPDLSHRGAQVDEIGRASCRERVCQYV